MVLRCRNIHINARHPPVSHSRNTQSRIWRKYGLRRFTAARTHAAENNPSASQSMVENKRDRLIHTIIGRILAHFRVVENSYYLSFIHILDQQITGHIAGMYAGFMIWLAIALPHGAPNRKTATRGKSRNQLDRSWLKWMIFRPLWNVERRHRCRRVLSVNEECLIVSVYLAPD